MAPPTLALRFLSLVLLFFMNGDCIDGRDLMKVKVSYKVKAPSPPSKAYNIEYRTSPNKSIQPTYTASYTVPQNNHVSHLNQPYITGYRNQPNYMAWYRTSTHDSSASYIAGYIRHATHDETNQPYTASYASNQLVSSAKNAPKISFHDDTVESYITRYGDTGPKINPKESSHDNQPFSFWSIHNDEPHITQYGGSDSKKSPKESSHDNKPFSFWSIHDDEPYITHYGGSGSQKSPKESSYGYADEPYVAKYGGISPKKESSHNVEPYVTQYGPKTDPKGSSNYVDHSEAFKTGFFMLDDLYTGNVVTLQFPIQEVSNFLPKKEADSIPFSISQLPSVLQLFSIPQDSPQASAIRHTIEQCEAEPIKGETKTCATSLESMLEFVSTIIGSEDKHNILTTSYPTTTSSVPLQKYTILQVSEINAPKWVACHPLPYPYALYYCHYIATGTKVFKISLCGESGNNKIEALGVCHLDTSDWSPNNILFKHLGLQPGQGPVCHFLPVKHLMWVPQASKATM